MEIFIFYLIVYSITNIILNEWIFEKIRNYFSNIKFFNKLLTCPTCFSFYMGFILYLIYQPVILTDIFLIDLFLMGLSSSGLIDLLEYIKIKVL